MLDIFDVVINDCTHQNLNEFSAAYTKLNLHSSAEKNK